MYLRLAFRKRKKLSVGISNLKFANVLHKNRGSTALLLIPNGNLLKNLEMDSNSGLYEPLL